MRRPRGDTLLETMVTVAVLGVLTGAVFNLFRAGAQLQATARERTEAEDALAVGLHHIARELPEALACYDLNGALYRPPGAREGIPAVSSPAMGAGAAPELVFLELDPNRVNPLKLADFVATDPANYRQVRYYASGERLMREVRPFNRTDGRFTAVASPTPVIRLPGHRLNLVVEGLAAGQVDYVDPQAYRVTLRATPAGEARPIAEVSAYVYLRVQD